MRNLLFIRQAHIVMRCFPVFFWLVSLLPVADQGKYHLAGPEEPIKAHVGSNVLLPCYVEPPVNVRDAVVEWMWMFNSSKTVHLFRNEGDDRESQDNRYKDRTTLNHEMLEHGDISLKLAKVTKNDTGIYTCIVLRLPDQDKSEERNVTLVVVDGKEKENPGRHSGEPDPGVIGRVIGGVAVGALIIFITYCVVRCRRGEPIFPCRNNNFPQRRNDGDGRGNGNPGDEAEGMHLKDQEQPN